MSVYATGAMRSFREDLTPEAEYPRRNLLGSSVNKLCRCAWVRLVASWWWVKG